MMRHLRVNPPVVAAVVALAASSGDGIACNTLHHGGGPFAIVAMVMFDVAIALCAPVLPAALVTSICGFGMVLAVGADAGRRSLAPAAAVAAGVALIAVSTAMAPPQPVVASDLAVAAVAVADVVAVAAAVARPARLVLPVAAGVQSVVTLALVYALMGAGSAVATIGYGGGAALSAAAELLMARASLVVNTPREHMPIQFATWQLGVFAATPVVAGHAYHTTPVVVAGVAVSLAGAAWAACRSPPPAYKRSRCAEPNDAGRCAVVPQRPGGQPAASPDPPAAAGGGGCDAGPAGGLEPQRGRKCSE